MAKTRELSEAELKRLESLSVHLKLDVLWQSAMARGKPTRVHIDRESLMQLRKLDEQDGSLTFDHVAREFTWRGLPFQYEAAPVGRVDPGATPAEAIPVEPPILTIEGADGRSGRIFYVDWHQNPEGYR